MMTRRTRLTVVGLIILIPLLLIAWLIYMLLSRGEAVVEVPEATFEDVIEVPSEPVRANLSETALEEEQEERTTSASVVSLSKTFTERYGSYSNEANFLNLEDVIPLMSTSFAKETREFIDSNEAPDAYYGVSTRVITVSVDSQDDTLGRAQVSITTQREESVDSPQNTSTKFQDIILTFKTEGGTWKVDSATWQ